MHLLRPRHADAWLIRLAARGRRRITWGVAACLAGGFVELIAWLAVAAGGPPRFGVLAGPVPWLPDGLTPLAGGALLLVAGGALSTASGLVARIDQRLRLGAVRATCRQSASGW